VNSRRLDLSLLSSLVFRWFILSDRDKKQKDKIIHIWQHYSHLWIFPFILFCSSFCFWWDSELELCPWMLTLGHAVESSDYMELFVRIINLQLISLRHPTCPFVNAFIKCILTMHTHFSFPAFIKYDDDLHYAKIISFFPVMQKLQTSNNKEVRFSVSEILLN